MRVLCIGEAMIELALSADGTNATVGVAGDALNAAIYLRRGLDDAHQVGFGSAVGTDALSDRIVAFARSHGLDCATVRRDPARGPGLYAISVDDRGERSFAYWRDTSAARVMFGDAETPDLSMLDGADVILFSAITLAILGPRVRAAFLDAVARRREEGVLVAFDSNYRPRLWESPAAARDAVARAWALTDLGFPSLNDEMDLFGETEAAVRARLAGSEMRVCVLKRGARGPELLRPAGIALPDPMPVARDVVDTTGAGDSFGGTFLAAWLGGADAGTAAETAHDMAMRVIGVRGAILP